MYDERLRREVNEKPAGDNDDQDGDGGQRERQREVYEEVTERLPESKFIVMDAAYKTPWIAKRILDDDRVPVLPYTGRNHKDGTYRSWDYIWLWIVFVIPSGPLHPLLSPVYLAGVGLLKCLY